MSAPFLDCEDPEDRYTLEPILNPDFWAIVQNEAYPSTWFASDITFGTDVDDWNNKLTESERNFLEHPLGYFAGSDKIVNDNIMNNFIEDFPVLECQVFYSHQAMQEQVHAEVYSKLITMLISDPEKRKRLFKALETIDVVRAKGEWAQRYSDREKYSRAERLLAFICVEGIFFAASFASIFYFRPRGILHGLCQSNDYISRDEGLHVRFACKLFSHIIDKPSTEAVHAIFREAVDIEIEFAKEALKMPLVGMKAEDMASHIKYQANIWLKELGYPLLYPGCSQTPFKFFEMIGMDDKVNFFEAKATSYRLPGVGKSEEENEVAFEDDVDF